MHRARKAFEVDDRGRIAHVAIVQRRVFHRRFGYFGDLQNQATDTVMPVVCPFTISATLAAFLELNMAISLG
jgi:hypothetical protein